MTPEFDRRQIAPFLTPDHLSLAASTGNLDIVRAIVEAGGEPSKPDALGDTPLHHAARLGLVAVAQWLSSVGAPLDARNRDGVTPLELADEYGQSEIVRLLQAGGAAVPFSWRRPKLTDAIRFLEFEMVEGNLRSRLLGRFARLEDLFVPLDRAVLRAATLVFYPNTILVAVEDPLRHGLRERFVLVHDPEGQVFCSVLNWSNERIYQWNELFGINLGSDEIAIVYMKFFFCFVRGQLGRFLFVERTDEIEWTEGTTDADRARVERHLAPTRVTERTADFVRLRGAVSFKNAFFHTDAVFALHACTLALPDGDDNGELASDSFSVGQGKLLNEDLLEGELPVYVPGPPGLFG